MSRVLPVLLLQQGVQEVRVLHLEWLWRQQKQVMALLFKVGQPVVCVIDSEVAWTATGVIVWW